MSEAYPQFELRSTPGVTWTLGFINPVAGLADAALLVTAIPDDRKRLVQAWAWWDSGVWVGPRHTNVPNGSICAYEPLDGTWNRGESLVRLLDLYTTWVTRHLYLRYFDKWPGRQALHTTLERLTEHRPAELCGRCDSGQPYDACCRERDLLVNPLHRVREFAERFGRGTRRPPAGLLSWLFLAGEVPAVDLVCPRS